MIDLATLSTFARVPLEVEAILDQRVMRVEQILALEKGSLIRLDRSAGENIDIHVGGQPLGYGEIVILENKVCIRLTDLKERD